MDDMKLREVFPQTTVYKDQKLIDTFKAANIPSFLRDWILKRKANAQGRVDDPDALRKYVDQIIEVMKNEKSITGQYLSGKKTIPIPKKRRKAKPGKELIVRGARENNLKNIDIEIFIIAKQQEHFMIKVIKEPLLIHIIHFNT